MSHHQKQQVLNVLTTYLSGNENLKKVINSPCTDRHGKILSRDGQKVFTASNSFNGRGNRFNNRRNRGNNGGNNKKKGNQKRKGSNHEVFNPIITIS